MIFKKKINEFFNFLFIKPKLIILITVCLSLLSIYYSINNLKINSSTESLISNDLAFKKNQKQFREKFPILRNNNIIVLEGKNNLIIENKTKEILNELEKFSKNLNFLFSPNLEDFYTNNGLILLSEQKRNEIINEIYLSQTFLSEINSNPKLEGFNNILELALLNDTEKLKDKKLSNLLDNLYLSLRDKTEFNWDQFFSGEQNKYYILFALKQKISNQNFSEIYSYLDSLKKDQNENFKINFTGSKILDFEEIDSVIIGAQKAGILSVLLVFFLLYYAFRSLFIVLSLIFSIIVGLSITLGLTTFFIGSLNIISVAFAVLFIGISVDFGIQIYLRYLENKFKHNFDEPKIAVKKTFGTLLIVATTSMIGFLSFIPTDYIGLSELGIISSIGILVGILVNTIFFPSLILFSKIKINGLKSNPSFLNRNLLILNNKLFLYKKATITIFLIISIVGLISMKKINFESDPMKLKDQNSQSVLLANKLMEENPASDYTISILIEDLQKNKINELLKSESVKSIFKYSDLFDIQDLKEELFHLSFLLSNKNNSFYSSENELHRLKNILTKIENLKIQNISEISKKILNELNNQDLNKKEDNFSSLQDLWFGKFETLINKITTLLDVKELDEDNIPLNFKNRYVSADNIERVEIFTYDKVIQNNKINQFVKDVTQLFPQAVGMPVVQVSAGNIVISSFFFAFKVSFIFLTLFSLLIFRKISYTLICISPLIFASFCVCIVMYLLKINLNFANMISLPLLFSLGTSYSIYIVKRYEKFKNLDQMIASSTPNAVFFSALTTLCSFSTFAISSHSGTSSMGILLFISLLMALMSCLIFLPFIIRVFEKKLN